jgi:hypothetical protein
LQPCLLVPPITYYEHIVSMPKHGIHDLNILLLIPKPSHMTCKMPCSNYYDYIITIISYVGHIYNLGCN